MNSKLGKVINLHRTYILSNSKNKLLIILVGLVVSFVTILSFFSPIVSGLIIDAIEMGSSSLLEYLCLLSLAILAISAVVKVIQNHFISRFIARISLAMKKDAFSTSLKKKPAFYKKYKYGEILFRVYNDTAVVAEKLSLMPLNFAISSIFMLVALLSIAIIDWRIFLFVTLMLVGDTIISIFLQRKGKIHSQNLQEKGEELYSLSQDQLVNVDTIQLMCTVESETKRNSEVMQQFASSYYSKNFYFGNSDVALSVVNSLWTTGILLIGGYSVIASHMTLGSLVYCLMLMNILLPFCKNIQEALLYFSTYIMMYDRHKDVIDFEEINFGVLSSKNPITSGAIVIEDLKFSYPGSERFVFSGFSTQIPSNKLTCVIGDSGIGKSTLLRLIIRKEKNQSGKIKVGNIDLSDMSLKDLRQAIRYVGNDASLFSGTLLENIIYGCSEYTDQDLDEAIKIARLNQVIDRLPDGIYTFLGKNGISLSEGEKQRVALARCLLCKPLLLMMDEATANVDIETNRQIFDRLRTLSTECTILVVSHSKEIESYADYVINLNTVGGVVNTIKDTE